MVGHRGDDRFGEQAADARDTDEHRRLGVGDDLGQPRRAVGQHIVDHGGDACPGRPGADDTGNRLLTVDTKQSMNRA